MSDLKTELKQTKPFRSLGHEAAHGRIGSQVCPTLLDRLEDMHLIVRERGGEDRRYVTTKVTAPGLKLLGALDPVVDGLHEAQLGRLGNPTLRVLIDLLGRIRDGA